MAVKSGNSKKQAHQGPTEGPGKDPAGTHQGPGENVQVPNEGPGKDPVGAHQGPGENMQVPNEGPGKKSGSLSQGPGKDPLENTKLRRSQKEFLLQLIDQGKANTIGEAMDLLIDSFTAGPVISEKEIHIPVVRERKERIIEKTIEVEKKLAHGQAVITLTDDNLKNARKCRPFMKKDRFLEEEDPTGSELVNKALAFLMKVKYEHIIA
jgi:hypothetical protein